MSLEEQLNLKKALDAEQIETELVTIPGAPHGLDGHFEELEKIIQGFEATSFPS